MKTPADKNQENQRRSAVVEARKGHQASTFQFAGNRPDAIQMRKLQELANNSTGAKQLKHSQEMANNSPEAKRVAQLQVVANQQNKETIQRAKDYTVESKTKSKYAIEAYGTPDDFIGGADAGSYGIGNVKSYQAEYYASNQLNKNGNKTGKSKAESSNTMNNELPEYANGHLLPKEMGGPGSKGNVFEQEGGQNSGSWRSFEIAASNVLNNTPDDENFGYRMELQGTNLTYGF